MNKAEQLNELAGALAKAQGAIKSAVKAKENPFFKSQYADLPAVMDACRKALSDNGLAVTQVADFDGQETWLETMLIHSSGQWISGKYPVRPVKNDPQGLGSAQTYARRYALMAMVGIVAENEDDDGNAASARNGNGNGNYGKITADQAQTIRDMLADSKRDPERFCEYFRIKAICDLSAADYSRAIEALNTRLHQKGAPKVNQHEH